MGGGSSGSKTSYTAPPEARDIMRRFIPAIDVASTAAITGQPLYQLPQVPTLEGMGATWETAQPWKLKSEPTTVSFEAPEMFRAATAYAPGAYRGATVGWTAPWEAPTYDLPSVLGMMPTAELYGMTAPEVMAGIQAPWLEQQRRLEEMFGSQGMAGSARGGYSGALGAATGKLASEAAQDIGLQWWNMVSPGLQLGYQTEAERARQIGQWGQEAQAAGYGAKTQAQQLEAQYRQQAQSEAYAAQVQAAMANAMYQQQAAASQYAAQANAAQRNAELEAARQEDIYGHKVGVMSDMMAAENARRQEEAARRYGLGMAEYEGEAGAIMAPWNVLPTLGQGSSPFLSTGVTTQPSNLYQQYVASLFGK